MSSSDESSGEYRLYPSLRPLMAEPPLTTPPLTARSRFARFFVSRRKTKLAVCGLVLVAIIVVAVVVPIEVRKKQSSPDSELNTVASPWGVTLLVDNDLEGMASTKPAVLFLSNRTYADAVADCASLGEALWDVDEAAGATAASLQPLLDYLVYRQQATASTRFWIANATSSSSSGGDQSSPAQRTIDINGTIASFDASGDSSSSSGGDSTVLLPVLCSQTAPRSSWTSTNTSAPYRVSVHASVGAPDNGAGGMAKVVGYRDHNSFRFLGIHYAAQPTRWTYAAPYWNRTLSAVMATSAGAADAAAATNLPVVNATRFGNACAQNLQTRSEDCLVVNVFTPYLPEAQEAANASTGAPHQLRPVMFFIHGGGLSNGAGGLATTDGGNLASRGDVVVVSINYRLGTFGYLALDSSLGDLPGNYGLADQILALDWVRDNIASFGGDPTRITIFGQSAGAASVRAIMASPLADGKFAAAAMMSGLGGVHNYGTTYSRYFTAAQNTLVVGKAVVTGAGCSGAGDAAAILACLRAVPASTLLSLPSVARFLVVDGTYLTEPDLSLNRSRLAGADGTVAPASYALMTGTMRDDGASFVNYPLEASTNNVTKYLTGQGLNDPPFPADQFPLPDTDTAGRYAVGSAARASLFNMTVRLATDAMFRCADQATVRAGLASGLFSAVYAYEFDRSYTYQGGGALADVCRPPPSAGHPYGDPSQPYYRCHSGDLALVFGNVARLGLPWRDDEGDRAFTGYILDSFAAFGRTHNPTPDTAFLTARGFQSTLDMMPGASSSSSSSSDAWLPATNSTDSLKLHVLDWPATRQEAFREQSQCNALLLGLDYYM